MNSSEDTRHLDEHFLTAPAIFPNNDINCEVNKTKAAGYHMVRSEGCADQQGA
jgi:hypothetical protein